MKSKYNSRLSRENTILSAIIRTSLLWTYIITIVQIYFIIQLNPGLNTVKPRLYLFLFCFINYFLLHLFINIVLSFFSYILKIKIYQEYYYLIYSFFILLLNIGFLVINYYRIGRGDIVDFFNVWFLVVSSVSVIIISVFLLFILLLVEKPFNSMSLAFKGFLILLITGLGAYIIFSDIERTEEDPVPVFGEAYEIHQSDKRVIFLAVDALNWTVLDRMIDGESLPNLKYIHEHGRSYRLETIEPAKSPVVWSSIYTSMKPERHGIMDFSLYKMPFFEPIRGKVKFPKMSLINYIVKLYDKYDINRIIIYNSTHRRSKAVWDILGERARSSSVLGGWVTYPAYEIKGNIVSPQFAYSVEDLFIRSDSILPDIYPPDLRDDLKHCIINPDDMGFEEISFYLNISRDEFQGLGKTRLMEKNLELLRWITAQDQTFLCISKMLWERENFDFMFLYFQQTDVLAHQFWHYFQPEYFQKIDDDEMRIFKDVIFRSYEKVDQYIGYILENYIDEDTLLLIASDHGMLPTGSFIKSGDHLYGAPEGVMFIYNPSFVINNDGIDKASIFDIAPTILYTLGFPYAEDFEGRVLLEAFEESIMEEMPLVKIRSYGDREIKAERLIADEKQERALEHLKSLGYIQ